MFMFMQNQSQKYFPGFRGLKGKNIMTFILISAILLGALAACASHSSHTS